MILSSIVQTDAPVGVNSYSELNAYVADDSRLSCSLQHAVLSRLEIRSAEDFVPM